MNELLSVGPVLRVGRMRTLHRPRVLIEAGWVVLRTQCGIDPLGQGFTESTGIPTCVACGPWDFSVREAAS